jgi:hypothetical protein
MFGTIPRRREYGNARWRRVLVLSIAWTAEPSVICMILHTNMFLISSASGGHGFLALRSRIGDKSAREGRIHCRPCKLSVDDAQRGDQWH